jgi:hypothetical protein
MRANERDIAIRYRKEAIMLKESANRSAFARVLGACLLASLAVRCGIARASAPVAGWSVIGAADGVDTVEPQKTVAGEEVLLTIDKKSPYQAGQRLQVFKSFDASAWRGKRIHVRYGIETALPADTRASDGILAQLEVRMQCDKTFKTSLLTIGEKPAKYPEVIMNIEVPQDAMVCGFGFSLSKPMKVALTKLKFGESFIIPQVPTFTLEGRQLFPYPKPGTALPELELGKRAVP